MKRKITSKLLDWKSDKGKKPLLIKGARQTGKTYTVSEFGRDSYRNVLTVNMERSREYSDVFERDLDPARIVETFSRMLGVNVDPERTLIFFDEIQASNGALTSLKYFCEDAPEYDVIATGSLLGITLNKKDYSAPVGKVDTITMHPLDFEEFLWADGKGGYAESIRGSYVKMSGEPFHDTLMDEYLRYLTVGGMPDSVRRYVDTKDMEKVYGVQAGINSLYVSDMARYGDKTVSARALALWNSLPSQLARDNRKFRYSAVGKNVVSSTMEVPFDMLEAAGIIDRCPRIESPSVPLIAHTDRKSFKAYASDVGLLFSRFGLSAERYWTDRAGMTTYKGALTENYVMQALTARGFDPYYWTSGNTAEVDFVVQSGEGDVIPIEVKASEKVRSKSLDVYREMYEPEVSVRISGKNFGYENGIMSIPLYAVFCLDPRDMLALNEQGKP